jgi:hypothetical protein
LKDIYTYRVPCNNLPLKLLKLMVLRSDSSELRLRFEDLVDVDGRLSVLPLNLVPATSAGTSLVEGARKPLLFDRVRTLDLLAVKSILKVRTKGPTRRIHSGRSNGVVVRLFNCPQCSIKANEA